MTGVNSVSAHFYQLDKSQLIGQQRADHHEAKAIGGIGSIMNCWQNVSLAIAHTRRYFQVAAKRQQR